MEKRGDDIIGVPEAAQIMKVIERRVRYMLERRMLAGKRLGRQWVIKRADAEAAYKKRLQGTNWRSVRARANEEAARRSNKRRRPTKRRQRNSATPAQS